ncbi:carbonic anhydrase [Lentinula detonsa]|uniref:Carbonic anhydrase n=1 Tax=Lentinula detonsa TaxID=2804962 RepID=A0AA38PQS3_9AGAR|nr:carbonic anhydrase [Lentinula detonsa]
MPFRHLAYSLYACNSNMFNMRGSAGLSTGAGVVRHCSSSNSDSTNKAENQTPIALPPTKKLAIVTCMDARINPFTQLGIKPGEAHIIRNAGGMARDALRSLVISQRLLGTREIAVYHHTGCGMATFSKPYLRTLITDDLRDDDKQSTGRIVDEMEFLEWPGVSSNSSTTTTTTTPTTLSSTSATKSNKLSGSTTELDSPLLTSLKSEVDFLRTHPLIMRETMVSGWVWDVGKEEAIRII